MNFKCWAGLAVAMQLAAGANAATLTVNSAADDGTGSCTPAKCTLRDAILSAKRTDTVSISLPANTPVTLTNGEIVVNVELKIKGPGARLQTVQRSTAAGAPKFRIFNVAANVGVTISGLTIANGSVPDLFGGGILNAGAVELIDCLVTGNSAAAGGGIYNVGAGSLLIITTSTISGNSNSRGGGGGILSEGTLNIVNSTISGNSGNDGGGVHNFQGTATITDSTITGNTAISNGDGGGIFSIPAGALKLKNTIVAGNSAPIGPDLAGTIASQGYNLIGSNKDAPFTAATGDQIGTALSPIDPRLGPLQDNGGPTNTHALLTGSPAIDRGSAGKTTDQRGLPRKIDSPLIANTADGSDIGAYEVQPDRLAGCSEVNLVVGNTADEGAGSLRSVITNACGGSTITFAANVRGAINLTGGELLVAKNLWIVGPGANLLSVQRSAAAGVASFRIFNIPAAASEVTISGLTIANGFGSSGGGIATFGTLTLDSVAIVGNRGTNGGGIFNNFGTLRITASTLSGNTVNNTLVAGSGGGLFNSGGTVSIFNSTISGNTANGPGGSSDSGGGLLSNVGPVAIFQSTITGNAADFGGGVRAINGAVVTVLGSIIALNTSPSGPDVNGPLTSIGWNIIGSNAAATITPGTSDQIGVTAAQLNLGPLQDNGGPTKTHALLAGSVAIDKGFAAAIPTDQRGFPRPSGNDSDVGAFEVQGPVTVVEFYNSALDHYFITWIAAEIEKLDAGTVIKGWVRTGKSLKTYTSAQAGTSPVCRYYIPPGLGDSHFFGRGTAECNATGQKNPSFVLEDPAYMQMFLPSAGNCAAGTTQVYRVFSNRADANHRYMTDKAVRDQMAAMGWLVEGDGPDAVVMCAPQ
jgi:CSLREA domain-containing protein